MYNRPPNCLMMNWMPSPEEIFVHVRWAAVAKPAAEMLFVSVSLAAAVKAKAALPAADVFYAEPDKA